jgi:hypothetical protein
VTKITATTVALTWTQVDDGTGSPAWYRVRYAEPPFDWKTAVIGCDRTMAGEEVGVPMSCTVHGLEPSTDYAFSMMSFRVDDGAWAGGSHGNIAMATTALRRVGAVDDLRVIGFTGSTLTLAWTQVGDGVGGAAWYRVKYAAPPFDWRTATIGCAPTMRGTNIGARMTCTVEGLQPGRPYIVGMMSFRVEDGVWMDGAHANLAQGSTDTAGPWGATSTLCS